MTHVITDARLAWISIVPEDQALWPEARIAIAGEITSHTED